MEELTNKEKIKDFSSKIELDFFRHNDKESDKTKSDLDILLTQKGREDAKTHGGLDDLSQSIAFGSPRTRTQETAAYHMAGAMPEITGEETMQQLEEKINQSLKKEEGYENRSSKIAIEPRLNFNLDAKNTYVDATLKAFGEGRLMKFLVEESDSLAEEVGDDESSTYSREAAGVASIIKKYIEIAPRFDELVNDDAKDYLDTMQRFMGTHQSVGESFLAKVIEVTKGEVERDAFIEAIKNKGFNFSEGFKVELITRASGESPVVRIEYKKEGNNDSEGFEFAEEVPTEVIEEIAESSKFAAA